MRLPSVTRRATLAVAIATTVRTLHATRSASDLAVVVHTSSSPVGDAIQNRDRLRTVCSHLPKKGECCSCHDSQANASCAIVSGTSWPPSNSRYVTS